MTYAAYLPKPGSLAEGVLAYLTANPDEELNSRDIAIKFDRPLSGVIPALRAPVHWQHLDCDKGTQQKPSVFRLGPARRRMLESTQPSAQPANGRASNALCSYQGQGLDVTRTPGCLRVSNGSQVLDLSAAQVAALAMIGPVLMGQGVYA